MEKRIELDAPNLGDLEKQYLIKAIDDNFISTAGPSVPEFEKNFADYLGVEACVAVQSGTAALHISLYELGIRPGDEVIVPVITFVAAVNPIIYMGATPVFVDIDPVTWNIDPAGIAKAVSPKTRAIIPVHLFGNPCNMTEITAIAKQYGLWVIEDATESLGAVSSAQKTGTIGEFGCFSFNGNKVITTGGGGIVATNHKKQAEHIKFLVNQARDASLGYYHPEIGFNYRMTNLEAALGLAQLERLEGFLAQKRRYRKTYQEVFAGIDGIQIQKEYENNQTSSWFPSVTIDTVKFKISIPEIREGLKALGVPSRRIFSPIVDFPPYQQYKNQNYSNSYYLYENGLNLPGSTLNTEDSVYYAAEMVLKVLKLKS
jgi:perosamine synthetase